MKIAIVHEWLVTYAGSESWLSQALECFPDADLFAVIDFLDDEDRKLIKNKKAQTTYIQNLPFAKKLYKNYLPLMPRAIEQLDLSGYDIIISSNHAVAKGVIASPDQLHISYVHSPMRYAWDLQFQYLKESKLEKGLKGWFVKKLLHKLRTWDVISANRVDFFVSNSDYIAKRIQKCYRREATTIHCGVDITKFSKIAKKEDFYLAISRLVPYKKMDLIVSAFAKMPDKKLVVIGDGPQFKQIKKIANNYSNIKILGYAKQEVVIDYMQRAKVLVFAAQEDFGLVPIEAQACGTPVIAYGKGGCLETVIPIDNSDKKTINLKPTGIFFKEQNIDSLKEAIYYFEKNQKKFTATACRKNVERFSKVIFKKKFKEFVMRKWDEFL
jgi:glycosyltransferase involved in cell wall biosynthesis